jgi:hypothetical protein
MTDPSSSTPASPEIATAREECPACGSGSREMRWCSNPSHGKVVHAVVRFECTTCTSIWHDLTAQEVLCGTARHAATSTIEDSRLTANSACASEAPLLPDEEWNHLSLESRGKLATWFRLATERLQLILDEPPTPASPPTEPVDINKIAERYFPVCIPYAAPGIMGSPFGHTHYIVSNGGDLNETYRNACKDAIREALASVRAASAGTAADFLKRGRWTHGALKAIRDEVCGCETMPRFITNPDCLDMVDNSALRWEVDWLTRQEFESIFPAPPVVSQKGKEEL